MNDTPLHQTRAWHLAFVVQGGCITVGLMDRPLAVYLLIYRKVLVRFLAARSQSRTILRC